MTEFVPNLGFVEEFALSPFARATVDAVGATAKEIAKGIAPVGDASDPSYQYPRRKGGKVRPGPGSYQRSISTRSFTANGPLGRSVVCRLYSNNYKSRWIEYGTVKQPPRRVLHKAVDAALSGGTVS